MLRGSITRESANGVTHALRKRGNTAKRHREEIQGVSERLSVIISEKYDQPNSKIHLDTLTEDVTKQLRQKPEES